MYIDLKGKNLVRRTLSAGAAVVALVAGVVLGGAVPASADDPIPGPVDEILDVPSRTAASVSGSPMGDSVLVDLWRAMKGQTTLTPPVLPPDVPKPITAPAPLARAGGSVLTAAMVGWAIGSNGSLVLIGLANGQDYDSVFCGQPGWYQGVTSFVNMGFAPDCGSEVTVPNGDQGVTVQAISGTGWSIGFDRLWASPDQAFRHYCYMTTGLTGSTTQSVPGGGTIGVFNGGTFTPMTVFRSSLANPASSCEGTDYYVSRHMPSQTEPYWDALPNLSVRWGTSGNYSYDSMVSQQNDPLRTPRCRIDWEDGTNTTGTGTPYRESWGIPLSASGLGCEEAFVSKPGGGPDLLPDRISVESEDESGAITEIADQDVPEFSPDQRKAFETGNGRGLQLMKVVGTVLQNCMTWEADCAGWWAASSNGTVTDNYRCLYAGHAIALSECGPYRHTFDTRTQAPTITDPATGTQTPWSAQPNTGNSLNPGTGPGTGMSPSDACYAAGWPSVANPVDWVLVPIKCSLVWAFVPRQTVVDTATTNLQTTWEGTGPGELVNAVTGWSFVAPGGGCSGLTFSWSDVFGHDLPDWNILNACPGSPLQPAAIASTVVISIGAVLGLIFALTRAFGGVVAYGGLGGRGD